jgi:hypothetical protein
MAHFDRRKYVEVHQRSPALGSTLGSKQSGILVSLVLLGELVQGDLLLDCGLVVREAGGPCVARSESSPEVLTKQRTRQRTVVENDNEAFGHCTRRVSAIPFHHLQALRVS